MTARPGKVVVVGLGPAGTDLLLPAARSAIGGIDYRFTRTSRHPAIEQLQEDGISFESFDENYERASDFETVYGEIVATLIAAAGEHGEVCYAVPGNPGVAERTVTLLREAAADGCVALDVIPGLSFVDLAWSRLGVDPMSGARVVDAQDFAIEVAALSGQLLIGHCISRLVLSDVKLVLLEVLAPETQVIVLQRLGLSEEWILSVELADLDREVDPDHLTSVFVDTGSTVVRGEVARLVVLAERLRAPGGCPWDAEQSHHSLARYLLEEAYETIETIEALPASAPLGELDMASYARLEDELGDLLYQVVFHSILASEAGAFTLEDVARGVHDKLVRRHPHVFGDASAETAEDVLQSWEQLKKVEKGTDSLVEDISPGLPSLIYAHKLYRKAAAVNLPPGSAQDGISRAEDAIARLRTADAGDTEAALGDLLAAAVVIARDRGVDAETSLRGWAARFRERFVRMEHFAVAQSVDLAGATSLQVAAIWAQAGEEAE